MDDTDWGWDFEASSECCEVKNGEKLQSNSTNAKELIL